MSLPSGGEYWIQHILSMNCVSLPIDSPRILSNPQTIAGEEGEALTLHCNIDSNPPTTYTWTKGESRQVEDRQQPANHLHLDQGGV